MSVRSPIRRKGLRGPIRREAADQFDVKTWLQDTGIEWPDVEMDDVMPFDPEATARRASRTRPQSGSGMVQRALQRILAHPRVRTTTFWIAVIAAVGMVFGIALGTIAVNNLVIKRSVELGELDDARRTFRTRNAILSADIARLSAPPRVLRRARKRLAMQPSAEIAKFVYLDPANNPLTRKRQQEAWAEQAQVANAIARGTRIVSGEMFLRPVGVSATTNSEGNENVPHAVPGDGQETPEGTPKKAPPEGSAG